MAASSAADGFALVIALVVLAAMSLAAAALMRNVDTVHAITGNISFREASIGAIDAATEAAWAALYENGTIGDHGESAPAQAYYASRQAGEDSRGVPLLLQPANVDPNATRRIDVGNGVAVRYVVERMCLGAGPPTPSNCVLIRPQASAAPAAGAPGESESMVPLLRVSMRVDGPRGSQTFAHAMIRDSSPPKRILWRILSE